VGQASVRDSDACATGLLGAELTCSLSEIVPAPFHLVRYMITPPTAAMDGDRPTAARPIDNHSESSTANPRESDASLLPIPHGMHETLIHLRSMMSFQYRPQQCSPHNDASVRPTGVAFLISISSSAHAPHLSHSPPTHPSSGVQGDPFTHPVSIAWQTFHNDQPWNP